MHALSLPFIDADRMTPTTPGNGTPVNYRLRFLVALVVLGVVWQIVIRVVMR
jgi:hypothetical protein